MIALYRRKHIKTIAIFVCLGMLFSGQVSAGELESNHTLQAPLMFDELHPSEAIFRIITGYFGKFFADIENKKNIVMSPA